MGIFFFLLFRAIPIACGGSRARSLIGAAATSPRHRHSNAGSKPALRPTPQLTATPGPQPTEQGQGSNHNFMVPSWIHLRSPQRELLGCLFQKVLLQLMDFRVGWGWLMDMSLAVWLCSSQPCCSHLVTGWAIKTGCSEVPIVAQWVRNPARIYEEESLIPGLTQWVKGSSTAVSCGVVHRCGSDLVLLWLWRRPAAAAPIWPLAWELPYATGLALKRQKKKKKCWSSCHGAAEMNLTRNHEVAGSIPGLGTSLCCGNK